MYGYAYASDPIANGFITQSGTADSFDIPAPNSTAAFEALAVLLGCNTTTTTNTTTSSYSSSSSSAEKNLSAAAACIRAQPAEAVLAAMATIPATTSVLGTFAPTADNATVFSDYAARTAAAAAGSLAAVPRLHGSNADEGETFAINFALLGLVLPRAYWGWHTLAFFGCPTAASAAGHARAAGPDVPSWRYMYAADYPNVRLTVDPSLGAYHGAELNPLFGTSEALGGPDTPAEAATGSYMRAAWAAFAKDPHCGLSGGGFGWPVLPTGEGGDEDEAQIVVLGLGNATEAVFEASSVWDSACPSVMGVLQTIGGPAGLYALASLLQPALEGIEDGDINAVSKAILAVAQEVAGQ
ncbi:hypothetical protein diail_11654 [Diaporthe ilicicola]|nr:hypothetical protein diail_11654 [Diaporthe ilicicola]